MFRISKLLSLFPPSNSSFGFPIDKFRDLPVRYKILIGNGAAIISLLLFAVMVYSNTTSLLTTSKWVTHTEKAISKSHQLMEDLLNLETGERGFLITGNQKFLEPYKKSLDTFRENMKDAQKMVSDNPEQVQSLKEIERTAKKWIQEVAIPAISMREDVRKGVANLEDLQLILSKGEGKNIFNSIRKVLDELEKTFLDMGNHEARYLTILIAKNMVDQESGQRGFLITGKDEFLEPYNSGYENFQKNMNELKEIVNSEKNSSHLSEQIRVINALSHDWLSKAAAPEIALRREINKHVISLKDINAFIETEKGKNIMDELRERINEFISIEEALMRERRKESESAARNSIVLVFIGSILAVVIILSIGFWVAKSITNPLSRFVKVAKAVSKGDLSQKLDISTKDEIGALAKTFETMTRNLEISNKKLEEQRWIKSNLANILGKLQGLRDVKEVTSRLLSELAPLADIVCGAFFLLDINDDDSVLELYGSYGYTVSESTPDHIQLGDGLIGECALNKETLSLSPAPPGYLKVFSGTGQMEPPYIMAVPVLFEKNLVGVIELASFQEYTSTQKELIDQLSSQAGVLINKRRKGQ